MVGMSSMQNRPRHAVEIHLHCFRKSLMVNLVFDTPGIDCSCICSIYPNMDHCRSHRFLPSLVFHMCVCGDDVAKFGLDALKVQYCFEVGMTCVHGVGAYI